MENGHGHSLKFKNPIRRMASFKNWPFTYFGHSLVRTGLNAKMIKMGNYIIFTDEKMDCLQFPGCSMSLELKVC